MLGECQTQEGIDKASVVQNTCRPCSVAKCKIKLTTGTSCLTDYTLCEECSTNYFLTVNKDSCIPSACALRSGLDKQISTSNICKSCSIQNCMISELKLGSSCFSDYLKCEACLTGLYLSPDRLQCYSDSCPNNSGIDPTNQIDYICETCSISGCK